MINLLFSICCSVLVGILFKRTKPNLSESYFIICINYSIAALLAFLFLDLNLVSPKNIDLKIYIPLILLMPCVFYLLNKSILKSGIIKTDIAQRISLIIPILASFFLFEENFSTLKWIGILAGFLAIYFILNKKNSTSNNNSIYLILVFFGYGIIDIFFKQIALQNAIDFKTYLFFIFIGCFIISSVFFIFLKKENKFNYKKLITNGITLGFLNFFNIFFYLNAHKIFKDNPSTVFATMNFGVITLASIIGVLFFKEKLSKNNIIGIILAFVAIIFVMISQFKNI